LSSVTGLALLTALSSSHKVSSIPISSVPVSSIPVSRSPSMSLASNPSAIAQVSIGSATYSYLSLVGHGFWAAASQDQTGDTSGGWGSAISADLNSWHMKDDGSYQGTVYTLPDRGWNTNRTSTIWLANLGTVDFQARVHQYDLHFNPYYGPGPVTGIQLVWQYVDSLLLSDYRGVPTTG